MDSGKTNALLRFIQVATASSDEQNETFVKFTDFAGFHQLLLPLNSYNSSNDVNLNTAEKVKTVTHYLVKRYCMLESWISAEDNMGTDYLARTALLVMHATMSEGLYAEIAWTNLDTVDQFEIMDMMTSLDDCLDEEGRFRDGADGRWTKVLNVPVDIHRLSGHSSSSSSSCFDFATNDSSYGSGDHLPQSNMSPISKNRDSKLRHSTLLNSSDVNMNEISPFTENDLYYSNMSTSCHDVTIMSSCDSIVFSPMFSEGKLLSVRNGQTGNRGVQFKDSPLQQYMQTPSRKYKMKLRKQEAELNQVRQHLLEAQLTIDEQSEQVTNLTTKMAELEKEFAHVRKQLVEAETNIEILHGFQSPGKTKLEQDVKRLSIKNEEMKECIDINKRYFQDYDELLSELKCAQLDLADAVNKSQAMERGNMELLEQLKCLKSQALVERSEKDSIITEQQTQIKSLCDRCDCLESELLLKANPARRSSSFSLAPESSGPPSKPFCEPDTIAGEIFQQWKERESFLMTEYQNLMEKYETMAHKYQQLESVNDQTNISAGVMDDQDLDLTSNDVTNVENQNCDQGELNDSFIGTSSSTEVHEVRVKWMLIEKTKYLRSNLGTSMITICEKCSKGQGKVLEGLESQPLVLDTNTPSFPPSSTMIHKSSTSTLNNSCGPDPHQENFSKTFRDSFPHSAEYEHVTIPEIAKFMSLKWPGGKVFLAVFHLLACLMGFRGMKYDPEAENDKIKHEAKPITME